MLSFGQIYQSLEQYDRDNYYVRSSEVETRQLVGNGWKELGTGEDYKIDSEGFKNLASGKDLNGEYLSKEYLSKEHRQGYDFTWSVHKSVTLYAFTSEENLRQVTSAMNEATKNLISFLEREGYIQYRETRDGETVSKQSDNATILVNTHLCGRLDPQIHNHITIFNITKTESGDWKAINSDALYSNKYMIEAYLENQLVYQLRERGIQTEFAKEGNSKEYVTKISGLTEEHWRGIARTSELIDQYLSEHKEELLQKYPNASESQLKEYAYLEIRQSKQNKTVDELFQQVENALKEQGLTQQDIIKLVSEKSENLQQEINQVNKEELAKEIVNKAIDEIIDRNSTFRQSDLYKAVFQISAGRVDSDTLVEAVRSNERLIEMGWQQDKQHSKANATYQEKFYTSQEVIAWEHNILKSVEEGKGSVQKITKQEYTNEKLTKSQLEAINHIIQSTDRYTAVVGWAGVGKTTFIGEMNQELAKINEIAQEAGYKIVGISNTNTAVNELREVGIEAMTTAKFLNSAKALQGLDNKTILIVDEASFLSTKDMSTIIDKTRESGCRIVFIGDDRQLPGVQAGSPFAALVRENRISHVKMTDIVRQKNEELKQAVYDIYHQKIESALEKINFKTIERDSALEIATHALKSDKTININIDRETFDKVKEMFEAHQGSATQYVQQFKAAPFESEILNKLGIEDAGQREAFFFYKDFGFHEGENHIGIKEEQAKEAIKSMIKMGWVVPVEVKVGDKSYGAYQKTGLFGIDPSRIKEILGEKYEEYKKQIEEQQKEILREIAREYVKNGYKDSAISVATNQDAKILNSLISEELKKSELNQSKTLEVNTWVNKNLDTVERLNAGNYNAGDKLIVMSSGAGISVGKELFVKEVDIAKNTLKVEYMNKKGEIQERVFNAEKLGDKIQAFQSDRIQFAEGEKIIFNNTYKDKNFANSEFAYVKSVNDDGSITVVSKLDSDKAKSATFSREELEKGVHFQFGYAVTADRMQGKTTQNIVAFETRNYENFLVSITRAKQNATIYSTLSKEKFIERASEEATKERIEKMAYRFNDEVFNAVKDQVYENFQQQKQQEKQQQDKEEFKGFEKEREEKQGFQYEKQNERYKESVFFASEALKNYEREQYQKWAKHFSEKDFKAVQKPQKPSTIRKFATAFVDSKYIDRKFQSWLKGETKDKFEKFSIKDQLKTWWANNLNKSLEQIGFQNRRDFYKTYEIYTKDKNGNWYKSIQKVHIKVRGKKTTIEGYTLTKDGIHHFRIEKQKGLFGIERELDKEFKFIAHPEQELKQEKEQEPKRTYSNEAAAKAKETVKQQQEKQQQGREQAAQTAENEKTAEQRQEKAAESKVERNEKDEVKKYVIQTIEKEGKITNREILNWAKENKIKYEHAIQAMKELNSAGKIYSDKYDEKTKTITYISTGKISEQKRAVEQVIIGIYKNTGKEQITMKDIQKELDKAKIDISYKTLKKHVEACLGKSNEGKYDITKTHMAMQDKQIVQIYVNSTKNTFTSKELGETMKKYGHEINEKRLEKYIQEQEQKDIRIVGFQKNQDGKIEAVYTHKDNYKQAKQEWLKKEGSIRQKADEQLAKAVIEKTKGSGLSKEEIDKKIQEATNKKHKGYAKSLRERVQAQERMKTQEKAQSVEHSRSAAAEQSLSQSQSHSLGRGR
ncbi:MobF family relaxase [Thermodesulfovibrio yellowstonii]|uniref:TrwC relaxase domain-containing protein n=1 Tax=Thermodesulfovibrio yellowstonii TaxID=28262 RepID=A0A9W6GHB0_9BACT|nr:MobF family relaxase [Thermodesulfovibrio islandicus]GLI53977.1 hypothetical protein TISLANDTSLP1_16700 [Thermodesulfovibrio islandicus]